MKFSLEIFRLRMKFKTAVTPAQNPVAPAPDPQPPEPAPAGTEAKERKYGKHWHGGETTKCRARLEHYCKGEGLDVGFGGDAIKPTAIAIDMEHPYTEVGRDPQHLRGDAMNLQWFKDAVLDYVFSSHLVEDFHYADQAKMLTEWLRVLRPGGRIVLYLPIEQVFQEHCKRTGQSYNPGHKEMDFCFEKFKANVIDQLGNVTVLHHADYENEYSFEVVIQKG